MPHSQDFQVDSTPLSRCAVPLIPESRNLLVQEGRLSAVIDFGQLGAGDPACDLSIAWTLFAGESREVFRAMLSFDAGTWARGCAWTLWKALLVAVGFTGPCNIEAAQCWRIIHGVIADHQQSVSNSHKARRSS